MSSDTRLREDRDAMNRLRSVVEMLSQPSAGALTKASALAMLRDALEGPAGGTLATALDVEEMVQALANHTRKTGVRDTRVHCICGWASDRYPNAHPTHQAAALRIAILGGDS